MQKHELLRIFSVLKKRAFGIYFYSTKRLQGHFCTNGGGVSRNFRIIWPKCIKNIEKYAHLKFTILKKTSINLIRQKMLQNYEFYHPQKTINFHRKNMYLRAGAPLGGGVSLLGYTFDDLCDFQFLYKDAVRYRRTAPDE